MSSRNTSVCYVLLSVCMLFLSACAQEYSISLIPKSSANITPEEPINRRIGSTRILTINPETSGTAVKIVLVIDNSPSMADEQILLASSFQKIFNQNKIRDFNTDFYIYTSTANDNIGTMHDPIAKFTTAERTKFTYRNGLGEEVFTMNSPSVSTYSEVTRWLINPPYNDNRSLKIRTTMTADQKDSVIGELTRAIERVGIDGSGHENLFCSMAYLLTDTGPNAFLQPDDRVAFIFLSDDDDRADQDLLTPRTCIYSRTREHRYTQIVEERSLFMNDILKTPTRNLAPGLIGTMKSLFGLNNFLVSGIFYNPALSVNDPTCAANAESPDSGINYYKLTQDLGSNGSAHSICSADYSLPVDKINNFLQVKNITHSSYTAPLAPGERITQAWILKGGNLPRLGPYKDGQDGFRIRGTSVIFPVGMIGAHDIIEIKAEVVSSQ